MAKKKITVEDIKKDPMLYLKLKKTTPELDDAAKCFWHYGTGDSEYVAMKRLYGTAKDVLQYMRKDVKAVRREWEEDVEDIINPRAFDSYHLGHIYACVQLYDSHIDFEAYPETETVNLTA